MSLSQEVINRVRDAVRVDRLLDTAVKLIEVPSPTGDGAAVADRLDELLRADGFAVERPDAGWRGAPAVVARWNTDRPGRTLQFNGHLDVVHLPYTSPHVADGVLRGSGASDMKGGVAAMIEATRILRDIDALPAGGILITAHELHESPWGDSRQVNTLIEQGFVGDGVLLPEYLCDRVPVVGRGMAIWQVRVSRPGEPVHEVLGGIEQPSVIAAGADVIRRFSKLDRTLAATTHPLGGRESLFIGQAAGGEMYNQSPTRFTIDGTRRWLSPTTPEQAERQLREVLATVEHGGANLDADFILVRDAFEFSPDDPLVNAFQSASTAIMGQPLPIGAKPFVDDGNAFVSRGGVCAITHGPDAQGAHTANESVPVDELVRVANVYALTAIAYCAT